MKLKMLTIFGLLSFLLFSCQVNSRMDLRLDESGVIKGTVKIDQGFISYYQQLLKTLGMVDKLDGADIFQIEAIKETLNPYPKVNLLNLKKTNATTMEGEFTFTNATSIMNDTVKVSGKPVLKVTNLKDGLTQLEFNLNRGNIKQVFNMASDLSKDPTASTFLPSESNIITESEYEELIEYMLGLYVPNVNKLFKESYIAMDVHLPRPIKSLSGDATYSGSVMKLKYPMVRLLTLDKPISVTVTY